MATVIYEPTQRVLGECDSIFEAEDLIAVFEQVDPDGVRAGDYGINHDEAEYTVYQEYHHRKRHRLPWDQDARMPVAMTSASSNHKSRRSRKRAKRREARDAMQNDMVLRGWVPVQLNAGSQWPRGS